MDPVTELEDPRSEPHAMREFFRFFSTHSQKPWAMIAEIKPALERVAQGRILARTRFSDCRVTASRSSAER
jgi:hypothetical protein